MGIKRLFNLIIFLLCSFPSAFLFSSFLPGRSFLLPQKDFCHFQFLNITPDKPKEIIFFTKNGEIIITDLFGRNLSTHFFPKRIINTYACSTACYLVAADGIYRFTLPGEPRIEKVLAKKITFSFSVSPFHFAAVSESGFTIYNLSEGAIKEIFSLPLNRVHSACRKRREFYLAESSGIYQFDLATSKWKRILTLKGEKILGIFNLEDSLYYIKRKGSDLYLVRYELNKRLPVQEIPITTQESEVEIKEVSPFLLLKTKEFLYLLYPSGFKVKLFQSKIVNFTLSDLNGDGLLDFGLLAPGEMVIFYNQRRELFLRKEKAVNLFSLLSKREDWEEGERVFLVANILNDQCWGEEKKIFSLKRNAYTAYYLKRLMNISSLLFLIFLPVLFALVLLRKTARQKKGLAKREVSEIVNLASEIVTLDHNFVVKGNLPAALRKLEEIFKRYNLPPEEFLPEIWDEKDYKKFLAKFLSSPHLHSLPKFVEGRILEFGQSWDCVKIDPQAEDVLLFLDKSIEGVFAHIFSDHFRYAQSFSQIKISYLFPTDWARKVKFSFFSDAESMPNLKEGHLAEDLQSLIFRYRNYFAYGEGREEYEKFWITILDLVGIIKGIIAR